ncbi:extracellular tyrosine-protein kinase PKDCC-like [Babylonia areolata]|uniref:extracellular tyrosine-protein kinase PKDCC-like n=1 Tax=Babylonia areolata TaxID=304850 RepID=UPI003FD652EE
MGPGSFLTRRPSLLLLCVLPAIGYLVLMYALIGRTCRDDSYADGDYFDEEEALDRPGQTFLPLRAPGPGLSGGRQQARRRVPPPPQGRRQHAPLGKAAYAFNCTNIAHIKLRKKIGHGVSKQTFLGEFQGRSVAVKMVTRHIHDVKTCLEHVRGNDTRAAGARSKCYTSSTLKLMKEILLAEQLSHPNIAQLLGYCARSEESDSTDIAEHGVVSVFELGSRFVLDSLQIQPWPTRLQHALDMADLLHYLHHSPLGSLVLPDFKEGHFVIVNSSLKLIDLDDIHNIEPPCPASAADAAAASDSVMEDDSECPYGVRCQRALCVGFNAKENLKNMNRLVLKRLLFPLTFPQPVVKDLGQLNADLDLLSVSAEELRTRLLLIQSQAMANGR